MPSTVIKCRILVWRVYVFSHYASPNRVKAMEAFKYFFKMLLSPYRDTASLDRGFSYQELPHSLSAFSKSAYEHVPALLWDKTANL